MAKKKEKDQEEIELEEAGSAEPADESTSAPSTPKATEPVLDRKPVPGKLYPDGTITITQFLRTGKLGLLAGGFRMYAKEKKLGGKKTRKEWADLADHYRTQPTKMSR